MSKLKKTPPDILEPNSPNYFRSLINASLKALKAEKLSCAWKFVNRAGQINNKSAEIQFLKGVILETMGEQSDALYYYDQSLKKQPDYANALYSYLRLANHLSIANNSIIKYRAEELLIQAGFKHSANFKLASKCLFKVIGQAYMGAVWINKSKLQGWAVDKSNTKDSIELSFECKGKVKHIIANQSSDFLLKHRIGNGHNSFSVEMSEISSNSLFYFPDGSSIPGSPIYLPSKNVSRENTIRRNRGKSNKKKLNKTLRLNIVIPVYKDFFSLKRCINSIYASKNKINFELILINDASPELEVSKYLDNLSQRRNITILKNEVNLGFVKSANLGLFYRLEGDCLLLNSDTIVYSNWLDRLHEAAYSNDKIATVTPLSNNSELTSYPIIQHNNLFEQFNSLKAIDDIAATKNKKQYIDIPSGVGFCFYIKRQCLNECGGLNETDILRGYGDEAEFCQRIEGQGWRNICATNVFVAHEGGKSFNHEKRKLALKNMEYLEKVYPDYKQNYLSFIREDSLRRYRYNIEKQEILSFPRCKKLLLLGPEQRVPKYEILEAIKGNYSIYWLKPEQHRNGEFYRLGRDREKIPANFIYQLPLEKKRLIDDLKGLKVPYLEYRDTVHYLQFMSDLPQQLNCTYNLYPHDYALICPRIYLIRGDGNFCGGPELAKCNSCLGKSGELFEYSLYKEQDIISISEQGNISLKQSLTRNQVKKRVEKFVFNAGSFKVGSFYSSQQFLQIFPDLKITIDKKNIALIHNNANHWLTQNTIGYDRQKLSLKIAIPHNLNNFTGYDILLQLGKYARNHNLEIEFLVFGKTISDSELHATGKVFVSDAMEGSDYELLKKRYSCSRVLFLYRWPIPLPSELLYCCENNLKISAFNQGSFNEHLKDNSRFLLLPHDANIAEICTSLIKWSFNDS